MSDFEGKAAFVTGAGSGIGRATSLALAARGAFVWVTDFNESAAQGTVELIGSAGGRADAIQLDAAAKHSGKPLWKPPTLGTTR